MKILITNHWLKKLGGSETFTYTLVKAAKEHGHDVDLFTHQPGLISERIRKDFGVKFVDPDKSYDLILANHNTCVNSVVGRGPIIQTCHGTIPKLEHPSKLAQAYVAISEEVQANIQQKTGRRATVIRNGIDINRFTDRTVLAPGVISVLSLSHSAKLNAALKRIFTHKGIRFNSLNKYTNPVWDIEKEIWQHDLVISLGRGAYESFACGRPVLVLDDRPYQKMMADGMVTPQNIDELATCNFSGRYRRLDYDLRVLIDRELELYNDDNQVHYRKWAFDNLDYHKNFQKYIDLCKSL